MQDQRCGWLFSFVLLEVATFGFSQEIVSGPNSTVVFLDQMAVFMCEVRADVSTWKLNRTTVDSLKPEIRSDVGISNTNTEEGSTMKNLTILAKTEYNGTRVQCLALSLDGTSAESENVTLEIQGVLSSPSDLVVTHNASSITISWTAPFSLDVTGVDPAIWYSVLIYNVTVENSPTAILCTDCINITETHYTFTPDYLSPCHVYNFSVIPVNGAGQGESSPNATSCAEYSSAVSEPHLKSCSSNHHKAIFMGQHMNGCNYSISLHEVDDCLIYQPSSPVGTSVTLDLCADNRYSLQPDICRAGEVTSLPVNFTTYDVQTAETNVSGNNRIEIKVEFIENTTANGYFIVFQNTSGPPDVFRAMPQSEATTTLDDIPAGTYTPVFYDIEQDSLPNESPAYEQTNTVSVDGIDLTYFSTSVSLESISVQKNGSVFVKIWCVFKEGIEGASCVVVYREYDNKTLVVKEYPQNLDFPVIFTVDHHNETNYTLEVFGKNGPDIDRRPYYFMAEEEDEKEEIPIVLIAGGAVLIIVIIAVIISICYIRRKIRSYSPSGEENRQLQKRTNNNNTPMQRIGDGE